jgi:hypothetical protein
MLPKVVFDKTALSNLKIVVMTLILFFDFYLCTQSHVYRGILHREIRTAVTTERS